MEKIPDLVLEVSPFSDKLEELNEKNKQTLLELWEILRSKFLSLEYSELSGVSKWFHNLPEEEKCEIIEVFVDCYEFQKVISPTGSGGLIKNNLKINFEKLNNLASREWHQEFPKFADIIGYLGVFYIARLSGFEDKFGSLVDIWIEKEIKRELNSLPKEELSKINGIKFARTILLGEQYGEGCESYGKNKDERIVFGECFSKSKKKFNGYPVIEGERYFVPKVIDVVKAGDMWNVPMYSSSRYLPKEGSSEQEENNTNYNNWYNLPQNLEGEVLKGFQERGSWKGIIDASCSNVKAGGMFSTFLSFFTGRPLEQMGCWEFYNLFFGNNVRPIQEKRLCLFQIPNSQPFVKEMNPFGPFFFSTWRKKNQFWSKCDFYGL
ncbi:hypothetical protein MSU_0547 [Mycoplasma suis str. Illinois]|uniref:Uncharacterized protein n=1 Tax=Mycoplasma suis (strain Illinois) TaxID=768700 RepID=F0QRG0_MYCSL|nr:hypothetical protein MSU_0547 [Mycoplasma suis str. Illinois]